MKYLFLVLTILWCSNSISQNGLVIYGHKQSMGMGAPIGIDYMQRYNLIQSVRFIYSRKML